MGVFGYTLAAMRSSVKEALAEEVGDFFSDTEIDKRINEAQMEICTFTECIRKSETPMVDGGASYSLPSDYLKTISIQYQGSENKLLKWVDSNKYLAETTITTVTYPTHFTLYDSTLYLYPTPSSSTDTYYHRYIALPEELSGEADVPYNGTARLKAFHRLIVDLAAKLCMAKEEQIATDTIIESFRPRMVTMQNKVTEKTTGAGGKVLRTHVYPGENRLSIPQLPSEYGI